MGVTNYHSVDSALIGLSTAGARSDLLLDAQGSVTGIKSGSGPATAGRYSPFGIQQQQSTLIANCSWLGSLGYLRCGGVVASYFVRARHYDVGTSRWTTRDSLWPVESTYGYVGGNPMTFTDATGEGVSYCATRWCPNGSCSEWKEGIGTKLGVGSGSHEITRASLKPCFASADAKSALLSAIQNAYCQALEFCGGAKPQWCQTGHHGKKWYYAQGSYPNSSNDLKDVDLYTISCEEGGTCVSKVFNGGRWKGLHPCVKECAFEHEELHEKDDAFTFNGRIPEDQLYGRFTLYGEKYVRWTECRAWCTSLRCLLSKAAQVNLKVPHGLSWKGQQMCGPLVKGKNPFF
jgi:RHS repeat-associated protein